MNPPTQATAERAPEVGDSIGQYRLVGVLGDVNAGRLYVAERQGFRGASKTVMLLCIRPELARGAQFRTWFAGASSIASRFEHPNVITTNELGAVEGNHFISMEYVPGESLASILTKCYAGAHVPPDIAATVIKHAANAVQYLHDLSADEPPVGHVEVDPLNLFVTYHGTVKLLGLGLQPIALSGVSKGSGAHGVASSIQAGAYRAPEELGGTFDLRANVYRLGVLLWTCLTGRPPHRAYGGGDTDAAAPSRQMVSPSSVRADVPEALDAIAMRAMSAVASERYQTARELSDALDRYLLRRESRPTHMHIRRWMERQLFDPERASLQRQIAHGGDVEVALSLLGTPRGASGASSASQRRGSLRPRQLWSVSHSVLSRVARRSIAPPALYEPESRSASHDPLPVSEVVSRHMIPAIPGAPTLPSGVQPMLEPEQNPPRRWLLAVTAAVCVAVAIGVGVVLSSSDEASPLQGPAQGSAVPPRSGQVDVRSTPEGAAVFVDGEPTGLRTPVVLKGLAGDRTLRLRVDKAGYGSQEREIKVAVGAVESLAFVLLPSDGRVRFEGAPPDAVIYVDDVLIPGGGEPARLAAGKHTLRVESQGALVFSSTVNVVAGEQTIRVDGTRENP
jgi:serine/threonine-protein kinase